MLTASPISAAQLISHNFKTNRKHELKRKLQIDQGKRPDKKLNFQENFDSSLSQAGEDNSLYIVKRGGPFDTTTTCDWLAFLRADSTMLNRSSPQGNCLITIRIQAIFSRSNGTFEETKWHITPRKLIMRYIGNQPLLSVTVNKTSFFPLFHLASFGKHLRLKSAQSS